MGGTDPVGFTRPRKGVSDKDMALVAGGNAERLLGLPGRRSFKQSGAPDACHGMREAHIAAR